MVQGYQIVSAVIFVIFISILLVYTYNTFSQIDIISPRPYREMPVNVSIFPEVSERCQGIPIKEIVEDAMIYWEKGGNGKLSYDVEFRRVKNLTDANIVIRFVDILPGNVLGITEFSESKSGYFDSVIITVECGKNEGRLYVRHSVKNMKNTMRHEFGHALGLGHAKSPFDIMAPKYELREGVEPGKYRYYVISGSFLVVIFIIYILYYINTRRKISALDKMLKEK